VSKKPMAPGTAYWLRVAVIGLAAFAFVGNAGHAFELLHGEELGGQPEWLAVGGAALPDVLLLVSVIRLRHGLSAWGALGLALSGAFVLWAGLATADPNLVARVASAWPLLVAVCAAGLLEYGDEEAAGAEHGWASKRLLLVKEEDHGEAIRLYAEHLEAGAEAARKAEEAERQRAAREAERQRAKEAARVRAEEARGQGGKEAEGQGGKEVERQEAEGARARGGKGAEVLDFVRPAGTTLTAVDRLLPIARPIFDQWPGPRAIPRAELIDQIRAAGHGCSKDTADKLLVALKSPDERKESRG
jgi:hypothetical protein